MSGDRSLLPESIEFKGAPAKSAILWGMIYPAVRMEPLKTPRSRFLSGLGRQKSTPQPQAEGCF